MTLQTIDGIQKNIAWREYRIKDLELKLKAEKNAARQKALRDLHRCHCRTIEALQALLVHMKGDEHGE